MFQGSWNTLWMVNLLMRYGDVRRAMTRVLTSLNRFDFVPENIQAQSYRQRPSSSDAIIPNLKIEWTTSGSGTIINMKLKTISRRGHVIARYFVDTSRTHFMSLDKQYYEIVDVRNFLFKRDTFKQRECNINPDLLIDVYLKQEPTWYIQQRLFLLISTNPIRPRQLVFRTPIVQYLILEEPSRLTPQC
jgi:hypothetical protein